MDEITKKDRVGWRITSTVKRLGTIACLISGAYAFAVWVFGLYATAACSAFHPQPQYGRTFHILVRAWSWRSCDGYVQPWVGHTYLYGEVGCLFALAAIVVSIASYAFANKVFGEKPEGSDLRG